MTPARPATLRQVLAIASLQFAATLGAQWAGGPTVQPAAMPAPPIPALATSPPDHFRRAAKMVPGPTTADRLEAYSALSVARARRNDAIGGR